MAIQAAAPLAATGSRGRRAMIDKDADSIRSAVPDLPTHCHPINKVARRQTFPSHEAFTSKTCPNLSKVSPTEIAKRTTHFHGRPCEPFRDLTGQRNGAMTIVGLRQYRDGRRSSWIAKCDCGNYEQRNHRNWQKYMKKGVPDACGACMPEKTRIAVVAAILGGDPCTP